MKFSYSKLVDYNQQVKKQRKYLKFYLGVIGYLLLFVGYNGVKYFKNAARRNSAISEAPSNLVSRDTGKGAMEHFVVWTYPLPPPVEKLNEKLDEKLYCAFAPCVPIGEQESFYREPFMLNLIQILGEVKGKQKSKQVKVFDEFVRHHAWYKMLHGVNFPHHVQSVALISIIHAHKNACVRTLGQDRAHAVCTVDAKKFKDYNPTDVNAVPPFAVQFMDMPQRFGILDYTNLSMEFHQSNLENEMQSLASLMFMPYLTDLVDIKKGLPGFEGDIIMNGWYGGNIAFPPNNKADVAITSLHVDDSMRSIVKNNKEFLYSYNMQVGPIGAADTKTYALLQELGLSTYHSSTLTSMMTLVDNEHKEIRNDDASIVIVDYYDDVYPGLIPEKIITKATVIFTRGKIENNSHARFKNTFELVKIIASADIVICFKIQTAFLAMANGAKTILVGDIQDMDSSAHGHAHLFLRQKPSEPWHHDLNKLENNASLHIFDRYRASFVQQLKSRSITYYDTANLFGILPLQRAGRKLHNNEEYAPHDRFHFVITTARDSISWEIMRTIESVFFFHPNAKVVVHSNTIPPRNSNLDIFADTGYYLEIKPYSFEELFKSAKFIDKRARASFLEKQMIQSKQQYWYTHEADLIKMLILERDGGVMMDIDMHLVKALPKSFSNAAAWKDDKNDKIGTAMLIFEEHNKFLRGMITDAIDVSNNHYNMDWYNIFGEDLITDHFLRAQKGTVHVKILTHETFYPFENESDCLTMEKTMMNPIDETFTFGVHMKNKPVEEKISIGVQIRKEQVMMNPVPGSVCEELLREHCIFCGALN